MVILLLITLNEVKIECNYGYFSYCANYVLNLRRNVNLHGLFFCKILTISDLEK